MHTKFGKNHVERYNALLAALHFTENPEKYYNSIIDNAFGLVFFLDSDKDYLMIGDEYMARYNSPFDSAQKDLSKYKIKDNFQFKNKIWYNSGIYSWALFILISISCFVPLEEQYITDILLVVGIAAPTLYFSVRTYMYFKFKYMAKRIVRYHQRLKMVYCDSPSYGKTLYSSKNTIGHLLYSLGIDIKKTDKY